MLHAGNLLHKYFAYMSIIGIGAFEVWFRYNTKGEKQWTRMLGLRRSW